MSSEKLEKQWPTLYKNTGTNGGQKRMWRIAVYVSEDNSYARYETKWGVVEGKMQCGGQKFEEGNSRKNKVELCMARAEKLWNDKHKKDLFAVAPASNASSSNIKIRQVHECSFRPMLAHDYHKHTGKVQYPVDSQAKLDGCRCCIGFGSGFGFEDGQLFIVSRQGIPFVMPHILADVEHMNIPQTIVLDGELYSHDEKFDDISGFIRNDDPECADKLRIGFVIFDCCDTNNKKWTWKDRKEWLASHIKPTKYISLLDTHEISCEKELEPHARHMVDIGYEGIMLRNYNAPYKFGLRSHDLLKFKFFSDSEFVYVGYKMGKGKFADIPVIECQTADGRKFSVTPDGSFEHRRALLSSLESGKYVPGEALYTVKYQELTKNGVPRFPVGLRFRDYE